MRVDNKMLVADVVITTENSLVGNMSAIVY